LEIAANPVVIFQKFTGSRYTNMADVLLPSTAFTEIKGSFYNTEGKPQQTECGMLSPGLSKDNWKITRLLFGQMRKPSLYSKKLELNKATASMLPSIYWGLENSNFLSLNKYYSETVFFSYLKLSVEDFFMSHFLCFNSKVLGKASKSLRNNATNYGFLSFYC
jgi:NADH dehydrogenase/NADH:ubiquinone oxidoreductase subunit G